jgi:hypothetical protein
MPFNVDVFLSSLALRGTIKTNKFNVSFALPPCFTGDSDYARYRSLAQDSELWCDSASIPGIVLQTLKFRRYGYGSMDTAPVSTQFNDVQLRFVADGNADNWNMFHKWINKTINSDSSGGMWNGTTESVNSQQLYPYETAYQTDVETSVIVAWFNDTGEQVRSIVLNQAIPTAISDIKLDWGDNGDVARFVVNFSIQDWNDVPTTS